LFFVNKKFGTSLCRVDGSAEASTINNQKEVCMQIMVYMCAVFLFLQSGIRGENDFSVNDPCPCKVEIVSCPKTYVSPSQVAFFEGQIFINMNDYVFPVPQLFSDQGGLFFTAYASRNDCAALQGKCWNCGKCNWIWTKKCQCGADLHIY